MLLLIAPIMAAAQQWGGAGATVLIDTVQRFKKPDTAYGYVLTQTCQQCQAIYRPIITIKKSMWAEGENKVRYWRRAWIFGRIKYHYKPLPSHWLIIDYKQSASWK